MVRRRVCAIGGALLLQACGSVVGEPIGAGPATTSGDASTTSGTRGTDTGEPDVDTTAAEGSSSSTGSSLACGCDDTPGTRCVRFVNECDRTIWPGASGTVEPTTAFDDVPPLAPGECHAISVVSALGGRAWGSTDCSDDACTSSGDSGQGTLVQFSLPADGTSVYDVSLVDAFNLPMQIRPLGVSPDVLDAGQCRPATCAADLNAVCAPGLAHEVDGVVVYCQSVCRACTQCPDCSDCAATTEPACTPCEPVADVCCTGEACAANEHTMLWKSLCPDAITYSGDPTAFACPEPTDIDLVFCP